MLTAGCQDVKTTKKVNDFGTVFSGSPEEEQAVNWFKATYGDPMLNNGDLARFVLPLVSSGISDKDLSLDNVTTFPVSGGSIYFFVMYDNFKKDDPITASWIYLENGREVASVGQKAGGDYGRFIVEFQKPDTGWGKGRQRITITGDGATASVDFTIGDSLQTAPLPFNPIKSIYTAGQNVNARLPENFGQSERIPLPTGTVILPTAQGIEQENNNSDDINVKLAQVQDRQQRFVTMIQNVNKSMNDTVTNIINNAR